MALPAMISDYSKQQSERFSNLGQSLAQLGQQVGQQLAMREYQRQATAVLPAMQENYRQAFESINRGDYADGYMKMMETNLQFGADQNPFLASAAKQATEMLALAGKQTQSEMWRMQQAGGGGVGGGGEYSVPSAEEILMGGMPAMQQPIGDMMDQLDMEAAQGLPTDQKQPSEGFSFGGGSISGPSLFQPTPDIIEDAARNIGLYQSKDRGGKQKFNNRYTTDELTDNAIPLNLPGYEGYYVVPITETFRPQREVSEKYKGGGREQVDVKTKPVSANKDQVDAFNAALQQAQSAGAFVQRSGQLSRIAGAVNGDWTRVKLDEEGPKDDRTYTAQIDNSEPIELTDEEYKNLAVLSSLPATIGAFEKAGAKFIAPKPTEAPTKTLSTADKVRAQYGKKEGAATVTEEPTPTPETTPRFSSENPYAAQAEAPVSTTRKPTRGRSSESRMREAKSELEVINNKIKNIDNLTFSRGRGTPRKATATEKAKLWEELNNEKKRLEKILSSQ